MEKIADEEAQAPYSELKLAIIGPLVSFGLAAFFAALHLLSQFPRLSLISYWLAQMNLVLAIFNLIPAFPLDGGRVLRSYLAKRFGLVQATEKAVKVSQVLAWIFGIVGFFQFNILLLLIAFFIYSTAQAELSSVIAQYLLRGSKVRDVVSQVPCLSELDSVDTAVNHMLLTRSLHLPVQGENHSVYILSWSEIRDINRAFLHTTPVKEVMASIPVVAHPEDDLTSVIKQMNLHRLAAIPVVENDQVLGLVKLSDVTDLIHLNSLKKGVEKDSGWGDQGGRNAA